MMLLSIANSADTVVRIRLAIHSWPDCQEPSNIPSPRSERASTLVLGRHDLSCQNWQAWAGGPNSDFSS
ncbi:hypothetical protein [Xanthomonas phage vB_XooS_NR08]|nr:hypothetical protein [Xanthomonas phage vB_XooS_NR08]